MIIIAYSVLPTCLIGRVSRASLPKRHSLLYTIVRWISLVPALTMSKLEFMLFYTKNRWQTIRHSSRDQHDIVSFAVILDRWLFKLRIITGISYIKLIINTYFHVLSHVYIRSCTISYVYIYLPIYRVKTVFYKHKTFCSQFRESHIIPLGNKLKNYSHIYMFTRVNVHVSRRFRRFMRKTSEGRRRRSRGPRIRKPLRLYRLA